MTAREPWTCPTCSCVVSTPYCPICGETRLNAHDLTLRGFIGQVIEALSNIDARLIRSFRCLVTRPGDLTVAYLTGQRKPYILPFPLFLVANLAFFGVQSLTSANIFSTPLDGHLHGQMWSSVAQQLVTQRLAAVETSIDLYAPVFNQAVLMNAKSLIILMVLVFALLPPILFHRRDRPFVAHFVFSLHLYAFLLLLFCVALGVAEIDVWFGGVGLDSENVDHALSIVLLMTCALYLFAATRRVYSETGARGALKASVLALAVACIVLGYRFALLPITLYST
jgi:hypothetical protein